MKMRKGQWGLQAKAKKDLGKDKWKWVFCYNMDSPGTITLTDDYKKALPAIDYDYFVVKAGHAYDFRVKRIE